MTMYRESTGSVTLAAASVGELLDGCEPEQLLDRICPGRRAELRGIRNPQAFREGAAATLLLQHMCPDSDPLRWTWLRGPHGKPEVPELLPIRFNLSHRAGFAACALADRPVGVDILEIGPPRESVVHHFLRETEQEAMDGAADRDRLFAKIWTAREALVKLQGTGLTQDVRSWHWNVGEWDPDCTVDRGEEPPLRVEFREFRGMMLAAAYELGDGAP